jgi:DNA-binding transcriptional ArsR family regulator
VGIDLALRAVADPTRRTILRLVRDDERAAGELADYFPTISRPAVSQHLRVLSDAGLVVTRKDGNRRMYRARPEGLAEAWAFLDDMWADRLGKLKAAAEREQAQVDEQARRRRRRR